MQPLPFSLVLPVEKGEMIALKNKSQTKSDNGKIPETNKNNEEDTKGYSTDRKYLLVKPHFDYVNGDQKILNYIHHVFDPQSALTCT